MIHPLRPPATAAGVRTPPRILPLLPFAVWILAASVFAAFDVSAAERRPPRCPTAPRNSPPSRAASPLWSIGPRGAAAVRIVGEAALRTPPASIISAAGLSTIRGLTRRTTAARVIATAAAPPTLPFSQYGGGRMKPGESAVRAARFWRTVGPIVVRYKFAQFWLSARRAPPSVREAAWDRLHETYAPAARGVALELRGLYVKIGQVMSSRADFVPRAYVDGFASLQDGVPPRGRDEVLADVRRSLREEHGLEMEDVFESFGGVLGSASIGQVHRAVLRPAYAAAGGYAGGAEVACKVMHPGAQRRFADDFRVFRWLCRVALPGWEPILTELERQMMTEFDYRDEASNLAAVRDNTRKGPYANLVRIPEPAPALCGKSLLVMEMLEGKKLADAVEDRLAGVLGGKKEMARDVLRARQRSLFDDTGTAGADAVGGRMRLYYRELSRTVDEGCGFSALSWIGKPYRVARLASLASDARKKLSLLVDVAGSQIFEDGCFNGDPHPGNVLELPCGRLGLIDYGQTRRLSDGDRLALAGVVSALGRRGGRDATAVADAMRALGFRSLNDDDDTIARQAELYFDSDDEGRRLGMATPQAYLQYLNGVDFMEAVPDAAVFVARTSFLFRGMGALLQQQIRTAERWKKHADKALERERHVPYRLYL